MRLPEKEAEIETKKHREVEATLLLSFLEFPFPVVQQAFCKLLICSLVIVLSLHTTAGMAVKSPYDTIEQAASYIIKHQNDDGGWSLIPGEESDVKSRQLRCKH